MTRKQPEPGFDGVAGFNHITGTDVFQQQRQRAPTGDDKSFLAFFPLVQTNFLQIGVIKLLVAPANFYPMQHHRLGGRLEMKLPLRLALHRLHGFQSRCQMIMSLTVFCVDLPADKQMGGLRRFFRFEIEIKGARNHPGRERFDADALPGGDQYICANGGIGVVGH